MKIVLPIILLLIVFKGSCQIWTKADIDFKIYCKDLIKKNPSLCIVIQRGHFNYNSKDNDQYGFTATDSLEIVCLSKTNGHCEIAYFTNYKEIQKALIDTCSLFKFIETNKDSLNKLQKDLIAFHKSLAPTKKEKRKIDEFETIVINIGKHPSLIKNRQMSYYYKLADRVYDYNGELVENKSWYQITRQIFDYSFSLVDNLGFKKD